MSKKTKPIVVMVADEALGDIAGLAKRLASEGMKIGRVLPVTGVITGSISPGLMPSLARLSGVMAVEDEAVAPAPPPDSPIQ